MGVLDRSRQHLAAEDKHLCEQITAYRGGLNATDRRRIERQLYEGQLRGVTATSSLELGVDIACLDAVVINGFPGSVSSLWQRAGRCGRQATDDAVCVLIAYPSAIDQWCMRHPKQLLEMPLERVVVDTSNPLVLRQHLLCAAAEQPLGGPMADAALFGRELFDEAVRVLHAQNKLQVIAPPRGGEGGGERGGGRGGEMGRTHGGAGSDDERCTWRADVLNAPPIEACNIRSIDPRRMVVLMRRRKRRLQPSIDGALRAAAHADSGGGGGGGSGDGGGESGDMESELEEIDDVEHWRIYYELFEGAIYLNQGRKLEVCAQSMAVRLWRAGQCS